MRSWKKIFLFRKDENFAISRKLSFRVPFRLRFFIASKLAKAKWESSRNSFEKVVHRLSRISTCTLHIREMSGARRRKENFFRSKEGKRAEMKKISSLKKSIKKPSFDGDLETAQDQSKLSLHTFLLFRLFLNSIQLYRKSYADWKS